MSDIVTPQRETDVASSARIIDPNSAAARAAIPSLLISADSHIGEPERIWVPLPASVRDRTPFFIGQRRRRDGAFDPGIRVTDMDQDGVRAEVLYPDQVLGIFAADQDVQEAVFPIYNDWLAEYCRSAPKRLFGIAALPAYDIDKAVKELQRAKKMGLHGALIWEVPHPDFPLTSPHYEKLWAAAAEMGEPINVHILTGFSYARDRNKVVGMERVRGAVNQKNANSANALFDFLWSGVLDRHPKLKLGMIECDIGWIPFLLQQWDYYFHRQRNQGDGLKHFKITRQPSDIFADHVRVTFVDDYIGSRLLSVWGDRNCMWSSDYPHPNMTWPNSKSFVARQIGELSKEKQERIVSKNVIEFYDLEI